MRLLLLSLVLVGSSAFAKPGDISCHAEQYEITESTLKNHVRKNLVIIKNQPNVIVLQAEIDGRFYSLSGDPIRGDFIATQSWGEGYTFGFNTRATFNADGALNLSQVEQTVVHRLACKREL